VITKCANPGCNVTFRYLRGGKLFLLDLPCPSCKGGTNGAASQRRLEYFWLCEQCSAKMNVVINENGEAAIAGTGRRPETSFLSGAAVRNDFGGLKLTNWR